MTDELMDVVDDLTLPRNVEVKTDEGSTWATEDALLVQLQDAIRSTLSSGSGSGGSAWTRNVLDSAALYQASIITTTIGDWCRMAGAPVVRDAVVDLRAWYETRRVVDEDHGFYVAQLRKWAEQIRSMVQPPHRPIEITGAVCPGANEQLADEDGNAQAHTVRAWIDNETREPRTRCSCGLEWHGWMSARELSYTLETAGQEVE